MNKKGKMLAGIKSKIMGVATIICSLVMGCPCVVYANEIGVTEVTAGIGVLKDLVLACVGGVGVIFLAWGLLDFGTAYSAHDTTQQSAAIKKVIGGLIMIAVPSILKLLGAT